MSHQICFCADLLQFVVHTIDDPQGRHVLRNPFQPPEQQQQLTEEFIQASLIEARRRQYPQAFLREVLTILTEMANGVFVLPRR